MATSTAPRTDLAVGAPEGRAPGAGAQGIGLTLLGLAPLTMFVVGALAGMDIGEGAPFAVIGLLLIGAGWLAVRYGTWSKIVGIVLTLLGALGGFWMAFGITHVNSPGDFVPAVLFLSGVGLSLYGGVRAIVRRRAVGRDDVRRLRTIAFGLAAVALVASVAANLLTRTTIDPALAAAATEVDMYDFEFVPGSVTVTGDATLLVRNRDAFLHDLAIPAVDQKVTVAPGSEALVDLTGIAAGTYTFYCTLHSDTSDADPNTAGMAGQLIVE